MAAAFSQQIPAYDIVATDERGKSVLIQVKASRSGSWQLAPITKRIEIKFDGDRQSPGKATPEPINLLIVVFVQMAGKSGTDKFYILRWNTLQKSSFKNTLPIWKSTILKGLKTSNRFMFQFTGGLLCHGKINGIKSQEI